MTPADDEQHLKLLTIFHYVVAGMLALFACFPIIHFIVGVAMMIGSFFETKEPVPLFFMGLLFSLLAGFIMLLGWTFAGCIAYAGRCLGRRKNYRFCFVMAAIECMFSPPGTVLGVFTILVLTRPSVKALFEAPPLSLPPGGSV